MTTTAKNSTNSIKIYTSEIKKSFGQIPNWLLFKIAQRLPATKHHAYCLLAYFLSLKSFTIITPETLAEDTGHSERSIYRYLGYLAKIGHVRIIKVRGDDARFITTAYEVYLDKFFWRDNHTDWQKDEIIEYNSQKDIRIEQDANTNWQKDEMIEKKDSSYNKNTRARTRNTENNTDNSKRVVSVLYEKNLRPDRRDFFAAVPAKLRNKKIWTLINSIMAAFKDDAFDFMTGVFCNETISDPIAYLWGAVNRKKADNEKRQSQTKETSPNISPAKPPKNHDGKKIKYLKTGAIYEMNKEGAICTEYGSYNIVQVESMVEKGILIYVDY